MLLTAVVVLDTCELKITRVDACLFHACIVSRVFPHKTCILQATSKHVTR